MSEGLCGDDNKGVCNNHARVWEVVDCHVGAVEDVACCAGATQGEHVDVKAGLRVDVISIHAHMHADCCVDR